MGQEEGIGQQRNVPPARGRDPPPCSLGSSQPRLSNKNADTDGDE